MAVYECCRSVVFAEQAAVNVVKSIPRDKPVPTGGTCKTLRGGEGQRNDQNPAGKGQHSTQSHRVATFQSTVVLFKAAQLLELLRRCSQPHKQTSRQERLEIHSKFEVTVFYLQMVHVALCPHHQLAGRDGLTTGTAGSTVSEQSDRSEKDKSPM